jgi:tetratricopeptide (TPR) repeat protein
LISGVFGNRVSTGRLSVLATALFIIFFGIYSMTAAPGVHVGDCGELAASIHTQSIAHPPGFPAFCLFYRSLEVLGAVMGSPAFRMNVISSACVAGSVAMVFVFIFMLGTSLPAAVAGAAMYGLCDSVWSQALSSEVYGLHLLLLSLLLVTSMRAVIRPGRRSMALLGLVMGLGLSNHPYLLLTSMPCVAIIVLAGRGRGANLEKASVIAWLVSLVTGLLPYLYLPFRSMHAPPLMWGDMNSLSRVFEHILRRRYEGFMENPLSISRTWSQLESYFRGTFEQLPMGIAVTGMIFLVTILVWKTMIYIRASGNSDGSASFEAEAAKESFMLTLAVFTGFSAAVLAPMILVNYESNLKNIYIHEPFFSQSYMYICTAIGFGFHFLFSIAPPSSHGSRVTLLLLVVVALVCFLPGMWRDHDLSMEDGAYQYAMNYLRSAPADSTIFAGGDLFYMPWLYLRLVEKRSDHVNAFQVNGFVFQDNPALLVRLAQEAMAKGGAFFTGPEEIPQIPGHRVIPWGILLRLIPSDEKTGKAPKWSWLNTSILDRPCTDYLLRGQIRDMRTKLGALHWDAGDKEAAVRQFEEGSKATAGFERESYNLGCLYLERGLNDRAAQLFRQALEQDPLSEDCALNLSLALSRMGDGSGAVRVLRDFIRAGGTGKKIYNNLGALYLEAGVHELAVDNFARSGLAQAEANLVRTLLIMDREVQAFDCARQRIEASSTPQPALLYWGAVAALRREKPDDAGNALAFKWAGLAASLSPGDPDPVVLLGDIALALGRRQEALGYFERAIALGSEDQRMLFNMAFLLREEQPEKALEIYNKLASEAIDESLRKKAAAMAETVRGSGAENQ